MNIWINDGFNIDLRVLVAGYVRDDGWWRYADWRDSTNDMFVSKIGKYRHRKNHWPLRASIYVNSRL